MTPNRPPDSLIGKTLGQFEVIEEIGRGGMATVYRARQKSINRTVALKVLPPLLLHDPSFYERFVREVDVIAHLEHPHIVPIYDFGETDGIPFIAMRYLAGGSVAGLLHKRLPTPAQIERPLSQVTQALDYAHMQGVIHRDLKPGNILLDEHLNGYLTDFGIARVLNSNLTGSAIIGTPAYMSPEQANGQGVDGRSDVYSLGIVLFEMLTGREPFLADTPLALMLKHMTEPVPSAREFRPEVNDDIDKVIAKATAKNPDERYQSAGDVAAAYASALRTSASVGVVEVPAVSLTPRPSNPIPPKAASVENAAVPNTPPPSKVSFTPTRNNLPTPPVPPNPTAITDHPTMRDMPTPLAPRKRSPLPLIAVIVIIIAIAVIGVGSQLPNLTAEVDPTPFPGSRAVTVDRISVHVPDGWAATERNDNQRRRVLYHNGSEAFVSLTILDNDLNSPADFSYAVERYELRYYEGMDWLTSLDMFPSSDGWVRHSYRANQGSPNGEMPPGQMDVFYLRRDPYLVVVETFSADTTGNDYVPVFQSVLDSLRVRL